MFPNPVKHFYVEVDLVAEMTVINPFDFFLEPYAEQFPFTYEKELATEPYLITEAVGPELRNFLDSVDLTPRRTIDFLVAINEKVRQHADM